jgi:hypothetical protein
MLIDPVPVDTKGLLSLIRVVETAQNLHLEQLETIGDELCAAQEVSEFPEFARWMRAQLKQGRDDGDLHIQTIRVALSNGELTAYLLRPATDSAYRLSTAWWYNLGSLYDVDRSIEKGIFVISRKHFEEQSLEWEVAGRPLLVTKKQANRFLKQRQPSNAQLGRAAKAIVEQFLLKNPGQELTKADFIKMMMNRLPACNKASGARAWKNNAPAAWRRPGAPSKRRSSDV